jgi:GNAT superfamily N-acetyltransferase
MPEVRLASREDLPVVAEALAAAFYDDPGWKHLLRDDGSRAERLVRFFNADLGGRRPGQVEIWMVGDGSGAAVWALPGHWAVPPLDVIRAGPEMARVFGRRLPLAARSLLRIQRGHPARPAHWYLHYLGVVPARQGEGLGSRLLRPVLERLDGADEPAYLESSTDRNQALYERHAFSVTSRFNLPGGGPVIRRMWRAASAP